MNDIEQTASQDPVDVAPPSPLAGAWGADLTPLVCERCDWTFLVPSQRDEQKLPPLSSGCTHTAG